MSSESQRTMVRFDFPPGATAKEIAEALKKAHAEIMAKKAEARRRNHGEAPSPSDDKGTTA